MELREVKPPPFSVEIHPVREVVLSGTADFAYWRDHLRLAKLEPLPLDGRAQVVMTAIESKFKGITFREVTIVVRVRDLAADGCEGVYLPHAFSSLRFFAWIERVCFGTPYYPAKIAVDAQLPARFEVAIGDEVLLRASAAFREPIAESNESWTGPIYLPNRKVVGGAIDTLFYARLMGPQQRYAFGPRDRFEICETASVGITRSLKESNFAPREWSVSTTATHARTKSIRR